MNGIVRWSSIRSSGTHVGYAVGLILATGSVSLLSYWLGDADFTAWDWRLPFLFNVVLVALMIRSSLVESPEFVEAVERDDRGFAMIRCFSPW